MLSENSLFCCTTQRLVKALTQIFWRCVITSWAGYHHERVGQRSVRKWHRFQCRRNTWAQRPAGVLLCRLLLEGWPHWSCPECQPASEALHAVRRDTVPSASDTCRLYWNWLHSPDWTSRWLRRPSEKTDQSTINTQSHISVSNTNQTDSSHLKLTFWCQLLLYGYSYRADRVKSSLVIFDIWIVRVSGCQKLQMTA